MERIAGSPDPRGWVGEVVHGFRLVKVLRSTMWCTEFLAKKDNLVTVVVLFHRDWAYSTDVVQSVKEAMPTIMAFSRRPTVCGVVIHGRNIADGGLKDVPFVIRRQVKARTLGDLLRAHHGRLLLNDVAELFDHIAKVLTSGHFHRIGSQPRPVYHGSLTPEDVYIVHPTPRPEVVIGGYERVPYLPVAIDEERRLNFDALAMDHQEWAVGLAPELAVRKSSSRRADAQTDVYVFGLLLYRGLTGILPYVPASQEEPLPAFLERIWSRPNPIRPSTIRSDLPSGLEELVLRSIRVDPKERPASVDEMAAELRTLCGIDRDRSAMRVYRSGDPKSEDDDFEAAMTVRQNPTVAPRADPPEMATISDPVPPLMLPLYRPEARPAEVIIPVSGSAEPTWGMGENPSLDKGAGKTSVLAPLLVGFGAVGVLLITLWWVVFGGPFTAVHIPTHVARRDSSRLSKAQPQKTERESRVVGQDAASALPQMMNPTPPSVRPTPLRVPATGEIRRCMNVMVQLQKQRSRQATQAQQAECRSYCAVAEENNPLRHSMTELGLCSPRSP